MRFYFNGLFQRLQNASGNVLCCGNVGLGQQDAKFIAAQTCNGVGVTHGVEQARADFHQQAVAGVMPERIIHFLETVEVQH